MTSRLTRQRGFTLFEALLATALLVMVIGAIAQAVGSGQTQTKTTLANMRGMALAEALMEEILSKPYADPQGGATPGPDAGETTRQLYDNIDDYHGFSETSSNIRDAAGNLYPSQYQNYTRSATAAYGTMTVTGMGTALNGITVTVTVTQTPSGGSWTLTRFVPDPS